MFGVNAAGLSSKLDSFDHLLSTLEPSIFFIEESKMKTQGKIKTKNSQNYQIFELVRKFKSGGGIAIGALTDLNPVFISEGDDEVEILVIQIEVQQFKIRCIVGYGPQENEQSEKKDKFWTRLSKEVEEAYENEMAIIFQMDGNLWAGAEVVKGDPNECNANGKLFKKFLLEHPYLCVVNNLDLCEGTLTRVRKLKNRTERSVLDFFVVCEKIRTFLQKMIIDEDKMYPLSRYLKDGKKDSDHNTMILHLNITFMEKRQDKTEMFNFKDAECQKDFYQLTELGRDLVNCFQNENNIEKQCNEWFRTLNKRFHQSFKKIRSCRNKKRLNEVDQLMLKRTALVKKLKMNSDVNVENTDMEIKEVEKRISNLSSKENRDKIVNNFSSFTNTDGSTKMHGVWAVNRKVFPKNTETLPFAKKNDDGKLVSSQMELKELYLQTFIRRLRHRPIKSELENIKSLKEELCSKRLELARIGKSEPWTMEDLLKVLKSLKDGKSRDPHGVINEIFKPGVGGKDFQLSFLAMCNKIKDQIFIPKFMKFANIVSIYKGKGSKMELENERGIFIVNIFRSIMMKIVYNDKYSIVDGNMSDSNVGARRAKNIRNHIFVLNGVINEAVNDRKLGLDIGILDYRQCFDSMWMEECLNDLWEAGIEDDKLSLIHQINKEVKVKVKTPVGFTESETVNNVVMQGETFGPLCCSVQVDTFGKECLREGKLLYSYKGEVGIPPLAMVDDLVCISQCGINSVKMNAFLNAKTNLKKLQFGVSKCHKMHVGSKQIECPRLKVDEWEVKVVENFDTKEKSVLDEQIGDHYMEESDHEKYLGDIISNNGRNEKNIEDRKKKGEGIVNQIMGKLENIVYGPFYFEVSMILRSANLINGMLTNSEAWYGVTKDNIEQLEQVDEQLLRRVLEVGSCCPKEMLYLETGAIPFRFIMLKRRLMFLHYIMNESRESLIYKFLDAQKNNPCRNDWVSTVQGDLDDLEIGLSFEDIQNASSYQFQNFISQVIEEKALEYLNKLKLSHSKVENIKHNELKIQEYLQPQNIENIQTAKFLFEARTRMVDVKTNFKNKYPKNELKCPFKCDADDTQMHLLECEKLETNTLVKEMPKYQDIFSTNTEKQNKVARMLEGRFQMRKKLMKAPLV